MSASVYAQKSIRDAFISGLSSPVFRQRLLEKHTLTLEEAVQHACSLELAQRNAESYVTQTSIPHPTAFLPLRMMLHNIGATASPTRMGGLAARRLTRQRLTWLLHRTGGDATSVGEVIILALSVLREI